MALHLGLRGNAYARIYRNGRGGAVELRIRMPDNVTPFLIPRENYGTKSGQTPPPDTPVNAKYSARRNPAYQNNEHRRHSRPLTHTGPPRHHRNRPQQPRLCAQRTPGAGACAEPSNTPENSVPMASPACDNFKTAINSGQFPVMENGVEFQAISLTPADAEFIRTHNLTALDICAIYGVPPHKIAILDRATFSNIEHQGIEYVMETLLPTVKTGEPELKRKLLPVDIQRNHHYRFNLDGRMRGDLLSRCYRAYAIARQWGWKTPTKYADSKTKTPCPTTRANYTSHPSI